MTRTDLVCAAWTAECILVYRPSASTERLERVPSRTHPSFRYFVRLFRREQSVLLRSAEDGGTRFDAAERESPFEPIWEWPSELAELPPYRVFLLHDGGFAGLPEQEPAESVRIWHSGQSVVARALPAGFQARSLAEDESGGLYLAGSTATGRLRSVERRRAWAVSTDDGVTWRVDEAAHGGLGVAWRDVVSGRAVEYRTVTVIGGHLVLSAEVGDLGEESTLLFVRNRHGRWSSGVFADDVFRAAVAHGANEIEVVSHRGKAMRFDSSGRRMERSVVPSIEQALLRSGAALAAGAHYEVIGVDAFASSLALLVSIRVPSGSDLTRLGEAIVVLDPGGDQVVRLQRAPAPELVTLCYAAPAFARS